MSEPCTVIIGAKQHLESLKERAGATGEVLTFSDEEALSALEAINAKRPQIITLERLFAPTSRGAALITRVKADPLLASAEIRVVSHDGSYSRVSPRRSAHAAAPSSDSASAAQAAEPAPAAVATPAP